MENLKPIRSEIDKIDEQILRLLNERAKLAKKVGEVKKELGIEVHAPEREREIINRMMKLNKELYGEEFPTEAIVHIYREIISACLSLEKELKVAYLGPKATFTHQAALEYFGFSAHYLPVSTIGDVFREVELGRADYGVVPVENTTEGVVNYTLDMFLESDLNIVGEIVIPIKLNLLSTANRLEDIRTVYSHKHALAQCKEWLRKNIPEAVLVETESTAKACELVMELEDAGAIASEVAAYTYHLNILVENIQDNPNNYTRFIVVGKRLMKPTGKDKTSLIFAVKDEPGALFRALESFYKHGVNLTRIVSRPSKKKLWDYVFFVDLEGHAEEENVKEALELLRERAQMVKVLGSYPKALLQEG
ncbi:MAG: prephenate dehydratase [Aquificaceae bacterium]|nr:prephenate dehydratase [Aquificaceae bacterium]MCS7277623.1 prephenate dehydratase [Aquificaceae bacterium]MDW8067126.1 prephenate dehydratase [Aquificaceae bacterium]MDW8424143.1 prephenate dehydratase [Aquificaceae bacterium]